MARQKRTTYAADTSVPVARTRDEIEQTLKRFGATAFAFATHQNGATVMFECDERRIRFELPMRKEPTDAKQARHERERWRALLLTIKSKLVSIECDIETFDEAFMAHVVMPNGQTVGDVIMPQINDSYKLGGKAMPLMLTGPTK